MPRSQDTVGVTELRPASRRTVVAAFTLFVALSTSLSASAQLTPDEIRRASAAAQTTQDFVGRREYYVVPVDPNAANARRELTQAEVDQQSAARIERARLTTQVTERERLLPGARAAEQTAVDNLVKYYDNLRPLDAERDYVLDIVGLDSDEEAALKRAVSSAQSRVNSLTTQLRDNRTALETATATNPEINTRIRTLSGERAAALQQGGAEITTLVNTLNQQQLALAAAKEAKKTAEGMSNLINEQQFWFEDLRDLAVSVTGGENAGTRAATALEAATVRERTLTAQITATQQAIQTQRAATVEQDRIYEMEIIKTSPRLMAETEARRSNESVDARRQVETQRAQIIAGDAQFAQQELSLGLALATAVATNRPATEIAKLKSDLSKAAEAHQAWRTGMNTELTRHRQSEEQMFERNRRDGIGETNSGETSTTIGRAIRTVNESTRLTETQKGEMIADLSAVDQGAVTSTGQSALVIAQSAPNMVEFENTWGTFYQDYHESVVNLSWNEFSLRMGAYTKGVTRAGVDAVKDLVMIVRELGDTQGEAFEAWLESTYGIKSDMFGSENLAILERVRSGFAKIMDPNDPEGARLAQELVQLGEKLANMAQRRIETTAGRGNVRKALEDTGYVVGTVVGVEEVAFRLAAKAPTVVRGVSLWVDASRAAPPGGATPVAGATGDAARAATGGTPPARDVTPGGTNAATTNTPDMPTDGTPWGSHLDVDIVDPPFGDTQILRRSDGTELRLSQTPTAKGSTTKVYDVAGRSDIVVRVTKADPQGAALDGAGYRALRNMDPDGTAFHVPERYQQHRVKSNGHEADGGILEVVEKAPTDWRRARAAGETMSPGRAAAYQKGMAKINENGFVMLDNKADNYAFRKIGEPDEWQLVIVDAGSVVPMKNLDPAAAARLQRALDTPGDEATAAGRAWENPLDPSQMTGRQIHTEWLAKLFDHLIDWEAINKLHPDFKFHTLGEGYKASDLFLNKRFPMNPMNGIENPGIAGPLRPPTRSPGPDVAPPADATTPARTRTQRERLNDANDASGPYSGTRRNPIRTGGDDDASGGSGGGNLVSVGGFTGTPVIDPIHFELGPGFFTSVSTYCPPCSHITDEYNDLVSTGVANPRTKARLQLLLTELSVCENFYCYDDEDWDDGYWELVQVISHFGNNAYDARDPASETPIGSGSGPMIRVLIGFFPSFAPIPVLQFDGTSDAHLPFCDEDHYHDSDAVELPVVDCEGFEVNDPDPGFCGYGTVSEVFTFPLSECPFFDN